MILRVDYKDVYLNEFNKSFFCLCTDLTLMLCRVGPWLLPTLSIHFYCIQLLTNIQS